MGKKAILVLTIATAFFLLCSAPVLSGEDDSSDDVTSPRIILRPEEGRLGEVVEKVQSLGLRLAENLPRDLLLFDAPPEIDLEGLSDLISGLQGIRWAEPDFPFYAAEVPDDPDYPKQWNLKKINMPQGWDISGGGKASVTIAVVDSGVAYRTSGKFTKAPDFAATHFTAGYDFINNDDYPDDEYGHGTHVAAIIASSFDNSFRAAGMAYDCSIMPVQVLGLNGVGTASSVASGINYAVDSGAKVICLSLASPRHSEAVGEAVKYAYEHGVLCVAAAGNEGSDPGYPGGMDCPADEGIYVLAVGATDFRDVRAHYSNYGTGLDLVAPGGDLTRDDNGDGYGDGIPQESFRVPNNCQSGFTLSWGEGTSMAAPHVAATAGLMLSLNSQLSPQQLSGLITSSCTDLGTPGWDKYHGYGLLDVSGALASVERNSYFFAEGTTRPGFEEWLCVLNPEAEAAQVDFTFYSADGSTQDASYSIPAHSRFSLNVNALVGPDKDVASRVESPTLVFVERAMYFDYHGIWQGGSVCKGATYLAQDWYFAEGTTRSGFEEWLTLANPGNQDADVQLDYLLGAGQGANVSQQLSVPARTRVTVSVNQAVGPDKDVSMKVTSDNPIVAERPMYFSYGAGSWDGGHDVMGANAPASTWYFAEGTTRSGFEEWLTLANPGDQDAMATVDYMLGEGQGPNVTQDWLVPAHARATVSVNQAVGPDKDVSLKVTSDNPIVAERPMYFSYGAGGWDGGSCEVGYDPGNGG
jgi:serine protease